MLFTNLYKDAFRKVIMTNIPPTGTLDQVCGVVWGGRVLKIEYVRGSAEAYITFLEPGAAQKYLDTTGEGIKWPADPKTTVQIKPSSQDDMENKISKEEQSWINDKNASRVVLVKNIDPKMSLELWKKIAQENNRRLEMFKRGWNKSTAVSLYPHSHPSRIVGAATHYGL